MKAICVILLGAFCASQVQAQAFSKPEFVPEGPDYSKSVRVDEKLGTQLTTDLTFTDHRGRSVTLSDYFKDELPAIVTFNYSSCPKTCSIQLNALASAMVSQKFHVGPHFRIITISLDPTEELEKLNKMRDSYIGRLPEEMQAGAKEQWTFLKGSQSAIMRATDSAGFRYMFDAKRNEYFHAAANIFVSSRGKIVRYVYGLDIPADEFTGSVLTAGTAEVQTSTGFLHRCYSWEPDGEGAQVGAQVLRYSAAGFVTLATGVFLFWLVRRKLRDDQATEGERN